MANLGALPVREEVPEENGEVVLSTGDWGRGGVRRQMVEHGEATGAARDLYRAQVGSHVSRVVEVAPSGDLGGRLSASRGAASGHDSNAPVLSHHVSEVIAAAALGAPVAWTGTGQPRSGVLAKAWPWLERLAYCNP